MLMMNPNRSSSRYSVHAGESSVTTKSSEETIENTIMYSHTALSHCDIIATQNGEVQRQVRYIKCKSAAHGFGMTQLSPSFHARDQLSTSGAKRTFDEFIISTVLGEKGFYRYTSDPRRIRSHLSSRCCCDGPTANGEVSAHGELFTRTVAVALNNRNWFLLTLDALEHENDKFKYSMSRCQKSMREQRPFGMMF